MNVIRTSALLACLLVAAAPAAEAIYIMTPLHASVDKPAADVGDEIVVTLEPEPENETAAADWAGHTVTITYAYDSMEGAEGLDEPAAEDTYRRVPITTLALDANARGEFHWTIPAEVDDRNVAIEIKAEDGTLLAIENVAVGDAPPMLMAATGAPDSGAEEGTPGPGAGEPVRSDVAAEEAQDTRSDVPALGALAGLGVLAAVALLVARRR